MGLLPEEAVRVCTLSLISLVACRASAAEAPTFNHDIAPILYRHCTSCHRPGDIAPFPLLTYKDAATRADDIASATKTRYMPPWKPEPNYGDFQGVRRLTGTEIATIQSWAKAGAPQGDPSAPPKPPQFTDGWQLGRPDLVLTMPEPFTIPASHDIYQCFVLPLKLPEDKAVSAVEFRPGNRKILHHSIFFLDTRGAARWKDGGSPEPGYRCFGGPGFPASGMVGGWTPGATAAKLPSGVVRMLTKGSDLVIQNHYHPMGRNDTDQSSIALYFSKVPVQKTVFGIPVGTPDLVIPAGEKRYRVATSFVAPIDLDVIGITPHMHLLGSEMNARATLPDGSVEPMIWIRRWDFNWQGQYNYKRLLRLPKGTRIDVESFYDNSTGNPRNPNHPPQTVRWGESTTDEMNVVFIHCQTANPRDEFTVLAEVVFQQPAWIRTGGF